MTENENVHVNLNAKYLGRPGLEPMTSEKFCGQTYRLDYKRSKFFSMNFSIERQGDITNRIDLNSLHVVVGLLGGTIMIHTWVVGDPVFAAPQRLDWLSAYEQLRQGTKQADQSASAFES